MSVVGGTHSARPLTMAQKQAGRFLSRCQKEAVQVAIFGDAEVDRLVAWRAAIGSPKPTWTHLMIRALVLALREHPDLNAHLDEGQLLLHDDINIGLAVAVENGDLLTPVIHQLRGASLDRIRTLADRQIQKARSGSLKLEDMRGAGFTLSNVGQSRTTRYATPVVPVPQVAILAAMAVRAVPVAREGKVKPVPTLPLSLGFDHRAINGVAAAAFLETFARILNQPDVLTGATDDPMERSE